jgi:hypothetical protein
MAAREERLAGLAEEAIDEPACETHELFWQRAADTALCAQLCESDADCADTERCVILDEPGDAIVFAEDRQDRFLEAAAMEEAAAAGTLEDAAPDCDGDNCDSLDEYVIVPHRPVAACDPFFDDFDALLSTTDVAALAAGENQ